MNPSDDPNNNASGGGDNRPGSEQSSTATGPSSPAPGSQVNSVWLVAGGTGGHIYPALALGESLARLHPGIRIEYCCGNRPNELEIYRRSGIEPRVYAISGRGRGVAGLFKLAAQIARAWLRARGELSAALHNKQGEGDPAVVVGFGSYASVPVLLAARSLGIPTAVHEQNAKPGKANKFLARGARLIFAGMEPAADAFEPGKASVVGNPVRENLARLGAGVQGDRREDQRTAREELGLRPEGPLGLVFGGSLGAVGLNRLVLEALGQLSGGGGDKAPLAKASPTQKSPAGLHFLWASGPNNYAKMEHELDQHPELKKRIKLVPYIDRMDLAYAAADFAVCRAGALTLAELAVAGLPAILVPLPHSAGGHQTANAMAAQAAGAAIYIGENAPQSTLEMATSLGELAGNSDKLGKMGKAAMALAKPQAGDKMADALSLYIRI